MSEIGEADGGVVEAEGIETIGEWFDDSNINHVMAETFLDERCTGCEHITNVACLVYPGQESRQHTRIGGCAMRTHDKTATTKGDKVNPMKASKRGIKQ